MIEQGLDRTWAEISLEALRHNYQVLRERLRKNTKMMAVVKAEAYGHGAIQVAKTLEKEGVDYLAVSLLDEAVSLRQAGIQTPILILSYTQPSRVSEILAYDLTQTAYSFELLEALSEEAGRQGKRAKIHIKLDTGMRRIGFESGYDAVKDIAKMMALPYLIVEGIFTHFAAADEENTAMTQKQFQNFFSICMELERAGYSIPLKHCCNSAALLRFPEYHMDMVRPGIILYGHSPFSQHSPLQEAFGKVGLKNVMRLWTRVIQSKVYLETQALGYGQTYKSQAPSLILTLPIGYADGYSRLLSGQTEVKIREAYYPQVGRICMDACMVEYVLSQIEVQNYLIEKRLPIQIGQKVLVMGDEKLSVERLAEQIGTINYELLSTLGARVPRVYLEEF